MSKPSSSSFFLIPGETPSRSISAPPKLESETLFAYATEPEEPNFDPRNDKLYEEFYYTFKGTMSIPPPLAPPLSFEKLEDNTASTPDPTSPGTGVLINIVKHCIADDSPIPQPFEIHPILVSNPQPELPKIPEFSPFTPYYGFTYDMNPESYYDMAKDQQGCRQLQQKLDTGNRDDFLQIFNQIFPHYVELMQDPFGNYLCQKLMDVCTNEELLMIVQFVELHLIQLALDPHGTRSIQKLLEVCINNANLIEKLISYINQSTMNLIQDVNGNHVIQKCLNLLKEPENQFIYDTITSNIVNLATHKHGCCVLQRSLDAASKNQKQMLVDQIVINSVALIQDQYGNYVVQYVLDLNLPPVNARLARIFTEKIIELSRQKFSSNVLEKCLQQNSKQEQLYMIKEICKPEHMPFMLLDQYANYGNKYLVLQRAIKLADSELQLQILRDIQPKLELLRGSAVGKKVYSRLVTNYPQLQKSSKKRKQ